jgi:DNA polymerase-3 subunit epsilon
VTKFPSKAEVKWWRQLKSSGHPLVNIEPWSHDSKSHQDYLERRKQMQDAEFSEFLNVLRSGKWIVLDTETTGVDEPEIIDLAVIDGTTEAVLFNSRFNPITPVEPEAARVNRLSPDDLLAEPRFSDKYPEIIELLKDRQIVIWNAKFDYRALIHTCKVHNLSTQFMTYNDFWCAMINYGVHTGETNYKGEPKWFKLTNAALREKIVAGPAHRALGDSITTARVMKAILACQV